MSTYVLMGLPFVLAAVTLDVLVLKTRVIAMRQMWYVLVGMLILTAIFDQLLTGIPIVTYNEATMLNIKIGYAPIEDFLYTIAGVIGIGSIWMYYEQK